LLGQPIDKLDRRQRLRELLHTGTFPPERTVPDERRKNRERILPLWEEDWNLVGVVVVVVRAEERLNVVPGNYLDQPFSEIGREDVTGCR
jgi:hypothetical protein